ncbi:MAG: hypothetical protein WDM80_17870 [Limisphaerales bacterium]
MKEENLIPTEPNDIRRRLKELRDALLQLHKALMDSERTSYEQTFGKIASPYQFLKLLTEDPGLPGCGPGIPAHRRNG